MPFGHYRGGKFRAQHRKNSNLGGINVSQASFVSYSDFPSRGGHVASVYPGLLEPPICALPPGVQAHFCRHEIPTSRVNGGRVQSRVQWPLHTVHCINGELSRKPPCAILTATAVSLPDLQRFGPPHPRTHGRAVVAHFIQ